MQTISDADKKIWMDDSCDKEWTIKIYRGEETEPKYTFTNGDIQDDSLEIEAQLFEGQYIVFGGCYARSLKLNLPRFHATVDTESEEPTADDYEEIDYQKKDRITVEATASVDGGTPTAPLYLFWGYIDSVTSESGSLVKQVQAYDILAYIKNYDIRALWNKLLRTGTLKLTFRSILDRIFAELNAYLKKDGFYGIPDEDDNAANLKPLRRKTDLFKNTFPVDYCYLPHSKIGGMRRNGLQKKDNGGISGLDISRWFCNVIGGFGYVDPQDGKFDILFLPETPTQDVEPGYYKTAEYYNTSISTYTGVAFGIDGYYKEEDTSESQDSDDEQGDSDVDKTKNIEDDHIYAYGHIDGANELSYSYTKENPDLPLQINGFYGVSNNLTDAMLGCRENVANPLMKRLYENVVKLKDYNPATVELGNCFAVQLDTSLNLSYTQQYPEGNTKDIDFTYLVSHVTYSGFSNSTTKLESDIEEKESSGNDISTMTGGGDSSGGANRFGRYRDRNGGEITVGSELKTVNTVTFVTTSVGADVTEWCEIFFTLTKTDESKTSDVKLTYTFDGTTLDYKPAERYTESGRHTISFHYDIGQLTNTGRHTWIVQMNCSNATLKIDKGCATCVVEGTGFDSTKIWDGTIVAKDTFKAINMSKLMTNFTDKAIVKALKTPLTTATDIFEPISVKSLMTDFTDSISTRWYLIWNHNITLGATINATLNSDGAYTAVTTKNEDGTTTVTPGVIILPKIAGTVATKVTATEQDKVSLKIQASFDDGVTWEGYNNTAVGWKSDIEMSAGQFNSVPDTAWARGPMIIRIIIPEGDTVSQVVFDGGYLA